MSQTYTFIKQSKPVYYCLLALVFGVVFNSCKKPDTGTPAPSCVDIAEWRSTLSIDEDITTSFYTINNGMIYNFEDAGIPANICPGKPVKCSWVLETVSGSEDTALRELQGRVYWLNGMQDEKILLKWNADSLKYVWEEEVDLKAAYPNGAAKIGMHIEVTFPINGSDAQNRAFLKSRIKKMYVAVSYHKY